MAGEIPKTNTGRLSSNLTLASCNSGSNSNLQAIKYHQNMSTKTKLSRRWGYEFWRNKTSQFNVISGLYQKDLIKKNIRFVCRGIESFCQLTVLSSSFYQLPIHQPSRCFVSTASILLSSNLLSIAFSTEVQGKMRRYVCLKGDLNVGRTMWISQP